MSDFLLGVPGKLKTVIDYLTTNLSIARSAKIDNLDTTLSSRAAGSTALSTAVWTNTRAGLLDGVVRSIQTGESTTLFPVSGLFQSDYAITSVDVAKSIVLVQPILYNLPGGQVSNAFAYLINATTLRVKSFSSNDTCRWTVLEFK